MNPGSIFLFSSIFKYLCFPVDFLASFVSGLHLAATFLSVPAVLRRVGAKGMLILIMTQLANNCGQKSAQRTGSFLSLLPSEWNPEFATRRLDLDYSMENKTYIETGGVGEDVVRAFMQDRDESDVCSPQADLVEAYCVGASLEALEAEEGEASKPLVAYLDDKEFKDGGGPGRQRPYRGLLTACDLYRELKKPVSILILSPTSNFTLQRI
jgi:hypothetical protein